MDAYPVDVSEQPADHGIAAAESLTLEELARLQHAVPVADADELAADVWESDEELDEFLADLRASRRSSLA